MPALASPVADERSALREYLAYHQSAFFAVAYGLADEQARMTPTVSALSIGGLIKHVTAMQRTWMSRVAAAPGAPPRDPRPFDEIAKDFADQHTMRADETLDGLLTSTRGRERQLAAPGRDRRPGCESPCPTRYSVVSEGHQGLVGAVGGSARDQRADPTFRPRRHHPGEHRRRHHVRTAGRAGGMGDRRLGPALEARCKPVAAWLAATPKTAPSSCITKTSATRTIRPYC